jgi:tetratricopeptide repeat protein
LRGFGLDHPDIGDAHVHLGDALFALGRLAEAEASWRAALHLKPDFAEVHHNLGDALLLFPRFEEGWGEYEWRWKTKQLLRYARFFGVACICCGSETRSQPCTGSKPSSAASAQQVRLRKLSNGIGRLCGATLVDWVVLSSSVSAIARADVTKHTSEVPIVRRIGIASGASDWVLSPWATNHAFSSQ